VFESKNDYECFFGVLQIDNYSTVSSVCYHK